VPGEIIGRARWATPCEVGRRADHSHSHRPYDPNSDHVRGRPVFWTDPSIEPLCDDVARRGVGVDFGATTLFSDVTFTVAARQRWGIVGRNGIGKTTLYRKLKEYAAQD